MLKRLSQAEWFTSRSSAASLYAPVYSKASTQAQDEMRQAFLQLASDDTPMVRRAAAKSLAVSVHCHIHVERWASNPFFLKAFIKTMTKEQVLTDGLRIYRKLASDDQDTVRLHALQDFIAIAQRLEPSEVREQLLTPLRQTVTDKSWRVRYMVANHFVEVRAQKLVIFISCSQLRSFRNVSGRIS